MEKLKLVLQGFQMIEEATGTGSKQLKAEILQTLMKEYPETTKLALKVAFDPFTTTHIAKINRATPDMCLRFEEIVAQITSVKAMNNELRKTVESFVTCFDYVGLFDVAAKMFTKSLNIGMSVKSINSALGYEFIKDLEIMKADSDTEIVQKWFDKGEDVYAEVKYDGIRGFAIMKNNKVETIMTYNLRELDITKMTHIVPELERLSELTPKGNNYFFDFEITGFDRKAVSGEVNQLLKGTAKIGCDERWVANVFDIVGLNIFNGVQTETYDNRRWLLEHAFETLNSQNVVLAKKYKVENIEQLNTLFNEMLLQGEEGLVVKLGTAPYELKRSKYWVKMKAINTADLVVVDWFKGKPGTKREGTIGGFNCQTSDGLLKVDVGSGFSDELLEEIVSNNPDTYKGKIVEVLYNMIITNKNDQIRSLFLPRLKCIRFDKNTANSLKELK